MTQIIVFQRIKCLSTILEEQKEMHLSVETHHKQHLLDYVIILVILRLEYTDKMQLLEELRYYYQTPNTAIF